MIENNGTDPSGIRRIIRKNEHKNLMEELKKTQEGILWREKYDNPNHYRKLVDKNEIKMIKKIGSEFGITINILAKEGNLFYFNRGEGKKKKIVESTVPKGQSLIQINTDKKLRVYDTIEHLDNFFSELNAKKAKTAKTTPAKP